MQVCMCACSMISKIPFVPDPWCHVATFINHMLNFTTPIRCLEQISFATMDARLEVTDSQSHEAVLGKIIEVLGRQIAVPWGCMTEGRPVASGSLCVPFGLRLTGDSGFTN